MSIAIFFNQVAYFKQIKYNILKLIGKRVQQMEKVERIKQKTVAGQVMEEFKAMIASGQFKVNEKIPTEHKLAELFGIGRSSVREAIKIFQYLGILDSQIAKGTFFCDHSNISAEALSWSILLGENKVNEIIEMLDILEQRGLNQLTDSVMENSKDAQALIDSLESEIVNMEKAAADASIDRLIQAYFDFHGLIIQKSENFLFISIFQTMISILPGMLKHSYLNIANSKSIVHDHKTILDSIKTGNSKTAAAAFRAYIREFMKNNDTAVPLQDKNQLTSI